MRSIWGICPPRSKPPHSRGLRPLPSAAKKIVLEGPERRRGTAADAGLLVDVLGVVPAADLRSLGPTFVPGFLHDRGDLGSERKLCQPSTSQSKSTQTRSSSLGSRKTVEPLDPCCFRFSAPLVEKIFSKRSKSSTVVVARIISLLLCGFSAPRSTPIACSSGCPVPRSSRARGHRPPRPRGSAARSKAARLRLLRDPPPPRRDPTTDCTCRVDDEAGRAQTRPAWQ